MIIELIVIGLDNKSLFIFNNITDLLPNYCFIDVFFLLGKKHQDVIVTVRVRVTYHHFHLSVSSMIVLFVVASVCTFIYITDWPLLSSQPEKYGCRPNSQLHTTLNKNGLIHHVTVESIPEVRDNLPWFIHAKYSESLTNVLLLLVFIHTKQN